MAATLPLPALDASLEKFLQALQAVASAEYCQAATLAAQQFQQTDGARLQQELEQLAAKQHAKAKSWVSDFWLQSYLSGRAPKALSSNVGFQIDFKSQQTGFAKAAELINKLAQVHHAFCQQKLAPPTDARGNELSTDGWQVLKGAMREPRPACDALYYASNSVVARHCSVLWRGSHYILPLTDVAGNLYGAASIAAALGNLRAPIAVNNMAFALPSALPSAELADCLAHLCQTKSNQITYRQLCDSWFCIALFESATDRANCDEVELLQHNSFMPSNAWQYKPFSYQLDLSSDYCSVQVEHSGIDGATLQLILQQVLAQDIGTGSAAVELELANWQLDNTYAEQIQQAVSAANSAAAAHKVRRFSIDYSAINCKISHDALIQFSLLYAQLAAFAKLRNTYEAVDTSHFIAGRTECLRANTLAARNLCTKLLQDNATRSDLQQALDAHKAWVIDCKTGNGFDRHLFALACLDNSKAPFFEYVDKLCGSDFLSTSTVGTQSPIKRFVFAPTATQGFGVNYSMDGSFYEYCLISNAHSLQHQDVMVDAITTGAHKLINLVVECYQT